MARVVLQDEGLMARVVHSILFMPRQLGVGCGGTLLGKPDVLCDEWAHVTCEACQLYLQGITARMVFG